MKYVSLGMTFRSDYAGSDVLWKVVKSCGDNAWTCQIVNEPIKVDGKMVDGDHAGLKQRFLSKDIVSKFEYPKSFQETAKEKYKFFNNLVVGKILHCSGGVDKFIRCEVVENTKKDIDDTKYALKAIALVGNWDKYELPHRDFKGDIKIPHQAEKIKNGIVFSVNTENIFECRPDHFKTDPTKLEPIDLTIPEPTEEEQIEMEKWSRLFEIKNLVRERNLAHSNGPDYYLNQIKTIVNTPTNEEVL